MEKILVIDNSLYPTGALKCALQTAEALSDQFQFIFLLPEATTIHALIAEKGFKLHTLPFLEISRNRTIISYLPRLWANAGKVKKIIRAEGIGLVHMNDMYNQLGSMLKLRGTRIPVVYHARLLASSYIAPLYGFFSKLIRRYADHIVAVSNAVAKDIGPSAKMTTIYDGISLNERLAPWDGLKDGQAATILYLGNYVRGKGQNIGLDAFIRLQKMYPATKLRFVGACNAAPDRDFRQELMQTAKNAGIAEQVIFDEATGNVEQTVKAADIVLNLSESESFSMVCLETMAYGVPLVASDCGGPRDITDNGQQAQLVPTRDAAAASEALMDILKSPAAYKDKAGKAKQWIGKTFSLAASAGQFASLYKSLLTNNR